MTFNVARHGTPFPTDPYEDQVAVLNQGASPQGSSFALPVVPLSRPTLVHTDKLRMHTRLALVLENEMPVAEGFEGVFGLGGPENVTISRERATSFTVVPYDRTFVRRESGIAKPLGFIKRVHAPPGTFVQYVQNGYLGVVGAPNAEQMLIPIGWPCGGRPGALGTGSLPDSLLKTNDGWLGTGRPGWNSPLDISIGAGSGNELALGVPTPDLLSWRIGLEVLPLPPEFWVLTLSTWDTVNDRPYNGMLTFRFYRHELVAGIPTEVNAANIFLTVTGRAKEQGPITIIVENCGCNALSLGEFLPQAFQYTGVPVTGGVPPHNTIPVRVWLTVAALSADAVGSATRSNLIVVP